MRQYHEPARDIPALEADVFVVGAGTAGCVAAVAAARAGAKVLLVEKLPVPSGTLSNGGNSFYSLYAQSQFSGDVRQIVRGLPQELIDRALENKGVDFLNNPNDPHRCPVRPRFNHEAIKGILCELLQEAGVKVLLQTFLCGVDVKDGVLRAAIIENKDGRFAVEAKEFIDCSGDGDLAKYAGAEQTELWQEYDKVSGAATSLPLAISNVDFEKANKAMPDVFRSFGNQKPGPNGEYRGQNYFLTVNKDTPGCEELKALNLREFVNFASVRPGQAVVNNSKGVHADCSSAETLSQAEMEMRIKNTKLVRALVNTIPGFEHAVMDWQAIMLGVRATKITRCDKAITVEDITSGARFEDEIGLYGFNDLASDRKRPDLFVQNGTGFFGFPYRMLLPVGFQNLFMAGRCVTPDAEAHMSTRNTVGCMIMGQAAGAAAALCAARDCGSRELPYPELRKELLRQDVVLDA